MATYLERDVRQLLNVTSLRNFERFIRAVAARNGQTLHKSALAGEVGVSVTTVGDWLSVIEASNQIVLLEPWYVNIGKRIVKSPKVYFADSGLLSYLNGINEKNLSTSPFVEAMWETYVFAEIRKRLKAIGAGQTVWYYRDKQQLEVDFLLVGGGDAHLIECKWTELPGASDMRNVIKLMGILNSKKVPTLGSVKGYVLSQTHSAYPMNDGIQCINMFSLPLASL